MIPPPDEPDPGAVTDQNDPLDHSEQMQLAAIAKSEFHNRRRRDSLIRHDLFAEPAWDLLLDLYVAHHNRQSVDVERLCAAAAVPETTALRWIGLLMEKELVTLCPRAGESANAQLALSARGVEEMERYLRDFLHRERLGGDIAAGLHRR
jgi:hypothetical protein